MSGFYIPRHQKYKRFDFDDSYNREMEGFRDGNNNSQWANQLRKKVYRRYCGNGKIRKYIVHTFIQKNQ